MFTAFVTISGEYSDGIHDYIDILLRHDFDSFDDALRWYESVHVKPWGVLAETIHRNNHDLVRSEAEYDIYEDGAPIWDDGWFINETIWSKED